VGEKQERVALEAGYRVVTLWTGASGSPASRPVGYDYDTFAAILNALSSTSISTTRCSSASRCGTGMSPVFTWHLPARGRVSKAGRWLGAIPPFLLRPTPDNPEGSI